MNEVKCRNCETFHNHEEACPLSVSTDCSGAAIADIERLAAAIADELFINGVGEVANNLQLNLNGRDLGGWSKPAITSILKRHLTSAFAAKDAGQSDKWSKDVAIEIVGELESRSLIASHFRYAELCVCEVLKRNAVSRRSSDALDEAISGATDQGKVDKCKCPSCEVELNIHTFVTCKAAVLDVPPEAMLAEYIGYRNAHLNIEASEVDEIEKMANRLLELKRKQNR